MPVPRTCHMRDSESDISQKTNPLLLIKRAAEGLKALADSEDGGGGAVGEYRWMNLTMSIGICSAYECAGRSLLSVHGRFAAERSASDHLMLLGRFHRTPS